MMYLIFDRDKYLELRDQFEGNGIDYADNELSEFNFEISDIAFELANTRYALAKAEQERDQYKKWLAEKNSERDDLVEELDTLRAKIKEAQEQSPVAWMNNQGETTINEIVVEYWRVGGYEITPLFSAPVIPD